MTEIEFVDKERAIFTSLTELNQFSFTALKTEHITACPVVSRWAFPHKQHKNC